MTAGREIIDRMREVAGVKTDLALARFLGVPRGTIASWRRRNAVPLQYVMALAQKARVALDWLLTGRGDSKAEVAIGLSLFNAGGLRALLSSEIASTERHVRICGERYTDEERQGTNAYLQQLRDCQDAVEHALTAAIGLPLP